MGKQCCYYKGNIRFTCPQLPRLCSFVLAVTVDGGQVGKVGRSRGRAYAAGNNLGTWAKFKFG
jgi:hypothetical protein